MSELIGRTLGQYQIVEQIGEGGMATVFKAFQPSLNRYVALKVLSPIHVREDPDFSERFRREAEAIANLRQPNILPVYDFGQKEGYSYIAMAYVEGARTLREVMAEPLDLPQVVDLIGQIAAALDHAHQRGIIHRDVKPSNVLMDGDWALLTDFGLAKMTEASVKLTGSGVGVGTPAYMSPEQGQGLEIDHRTDVYSLGIILFEMLTGQIPHDAETPFAIVLKRVTEPLPLPRAINPDIPEVVERVILKALARDPDDRYAAAGEMAQALECRPDDSHRATAMRIEPVRQAYKVPRIFTGDRDAERTRRAQRDRRVMLERVRSFWVKGVLQQSLYDVARVELGLEDLPDAVEHPWDLIVQQVHRQPRAIPRGTSVSQVFEELGQAMLILGAPGAGKTTMLLELARDLLDRAERGESDLIPVVFNLSSWATKRRLLEGWLVDELNQRYDVPRRTGEAWVDGELIVPLLDGLDEVAPEYRDACAEAINAFRQEHGMVPLAVCSRRRAYEALAARLRLQGAVLVQPLSREEVERYLGRAARRLAGLREALREDETLYELLDTPLMLSIAAMAYSEETSLAWRPDGTAEEQRERLFAAYTDAMFGRRSRDARYTRQETERWLAWLASAMTRHNQSVLFMEWMQPSWLPTRSQQRMVIWGAVVLPALVGGLAGGMIFGLVGGLVGGLACGLVVGLGSGLAGWREGESIRPAETVRWSWTRARGGLAGGLACGLVVGLLLALGVGLDVGLAFGLLGGLLFGMVAGLIRGEITTRSHPNEGMSRSARNALAVGLIFGLVFGLPGTLSAGLLFGMVGEMGVGLAAGLAFGLVVALAVGLRNGGSACLRHLLLRLLLRYNDYAPLDYVRFLDYATTRAFLRKVGGGYIFIHRLLQEHFAELHGGEDVDSR